MEAQCSSTTHTYPVTGNCILGMRNESLRRVELRSSAQVCVTKGSAETKHAVRKVHKRCKEGTTAENHQDVKTSPATQAIVQPLMQAHHPHQTYERKEPELAGANKNKGNSPPDRSPSSSSGGGFVTVHRLMVVTVVIARREDNSTIQRKAQQQVTRKANTTRHDMVVS